MIGRAMNKESMLRPKRPRVGVSRAPSYVSEAKILEEFASLNLVGRSHTFLQALKLINRIARCDAPVLIQGETGTGKEMAARAIHYLGARRGHPFIPVNCGAIPESLLENELFGHEKGAFTDAKEPQIGLVAQADRGTLFLDEVEMLSAKGQIALLRFLQDTEYKPLGSKHLRKADARVIAASNIDLQTLVKQGDFRWDLLFRLNILVLALPPLRERSGDSELLAHHFICEYSARYNERMKVLHPRTLAWVKSHDWPGNVRELENFIHRAFLISDGAVILPDNVDESAAQGIFARNSTGPSDVSFNQAKARLIADFERQYLARLMAETDGNVTLAAKRAGKERRALGKLLRKHGIERGRYTAQH